MHERKDLEEQIYQRMKQEHDALIEKLEEGGVDGAISCAYEIAFKENILMIFEDETDLSLRQLRALLDKEQPLETIYRDWCERDVSEMSLYRESVAACAGDLLHEQAEKKYSDPNEPIYKKSMAEAHINGEYPEWNASHGRNLDCARKFRKEAEDAYCAGEFVLFLKKWAAEYGVERCMFVLSCTAAQRIGDGYFCGAARQVTERFSPLREKMSNCLKGYACDVRSIPINSAMDYLVRAERIREKYGNTPSKKKTQMER